MLRLQGSRLGQLPRRGTRVWVEEGIGQALLQGTFLLPVHPAAQPSARGKWKKIRVLQRKGHPSRRDKNGENPGTDQCLELGNEMNKGY